jgi:hypothetical protein
VTSSDSRGYWVVKTNTNERFTTTRDEIAVISK